MPLIDDDDQQALERSVLTKAGVDLDPTFTEIAAAAWRTENTLGSLFSREEGLPRYGTSLDFNPWTELTDSEKLDPEFVSNAMLANNIDEVDAVRRQSERERKDRRTIAEGGATSFLLGFGAGVLDPINLIPVGGTAYKTYRGGSSILKSGMVTGSVASGSTAATEAMLHHTQIERTYGESAVNVSAAFLLGGVLGGGIEGLAGRGVDKKVLNEVTESMDKESIFRSGGDSVGAAKVSQDIEIKGKKVKVIAKRLAFDPATRTLTSDMPETRALSNELIENPYEMDGAAGTAVESLIKIHDGKYIAANEIHLEQYKAYQTRLGGGTGIKRLANRNGISRKEFAELVAIEHRNPSTTAAPEVKAAADAWEQHLYKPLRDEGIDSGVLGEDVGVTTAANYQNRIWNKEKLSAGLDSFISTTSKWLEEQNLVLFEKGRAAEIELKAAKGARKAELEAIVKKAKFKQGLDLESDDFEDVAKQIAMRIMGTPDGMMPYDWKIGEGSTKGVASTSLKGPLKSRVFNIPDRLIEDFLENDIERVAARYLRQVTPDIELHRRFGDVEMKSQIKDIQSGWTAKLEEAKTLKEKQAITKAMEKDVRDIAGMRDRIRGIYEQPDHDSVFVRAMRSARDLNYLRFMGGVVASSVPDVARTFMAEGFSNTFKYGLKPLIKNLQGFKVASKEARAYGATAEYMLGGRGQIMADVADYTQGGTAFERGLRSAAEGFGRINLMDQWTTGMKQLHAVTMQSSIFDGLSKGKIDKRLKRLGISDADAMNMWEQVQKHGRKDGDTWITGAKNWDSPELEKIWGAAMRKESDRVIVVPGQEKPLFMSREMGKTVMQFRSFMFSSTQRMLIAGLQGQDHNYIGGTLMITAIGMMSYAFKQWDAGRDITDDPLELTIEGIDRSGSLGVIMEMNNTVEKISNSNYGLRPLLGVKQPAARFASRSNNEAFLGPTFGSLLDTTLRVAAAGSDDNEWKQADTRALRRLLPYQNLTLLRQLFDKIEKGLQ